MFEIRNSLDFYENSWRNIRTLWLTNREGDMRPIVQLRHITWRNGYGVIG